MGCMACCRSQAQPVTRPAFAARPAVSTVRPPPRRPVPFTVAAGRPAAAKRGLPVVNAASRLSRALKDVPMLDPEGGTSEPNLQMRKQTTLWDVHGAFYKCRGVRGRSSCIELWL